MGDQLYPNAGFSAERANTPSEFLLDAHVIKHGVTIDKTARDSAHTGKTTTLRPALVLGKITASGKYKEYDPSASDGSEVALGILEDQVKVIDADANAVDAQGVIIRHGRVDESALIGLDAAAKVDMAGLVIFD